MHAGHVVDVGHRFAPAGHGRARIAARIGAVTGLAATASAVRCQGGRVSRPGTARTSSGSAGSVLAGSGVSDTETPYVRGSRLRLRLSAIGHGERFGNPEFDGWLIMSGCLAQVYARQARFTLADMGRARSRQDITRRPVASGSEWAKFRAQLWAAWGPLVKCAACGHPIMPGRGEVQHQVPPAVNASLIYEVSNVVPVHGSTYRGKRGNRRCPTCDLACNAVLAGNHAPRNADGTPVLPWPEAFLARKSEERARFLATGTRPGHGHEVRGEFSPNPAPAPTTARRADGCGHVGSPGRCWECMAPGLKPAVPVAGPTTARRHEPGPPGSAGWIAARDRAAGYVPQDW